MMREASEVRELTAVRDGRGNAIDLSSLRTLLMLIDARYHPDQVWLFGSRARGEARAQSDWDLLVVVPDSLDEAALDVEAAWSLRRESGVRADLSLCSRSDFVSARDIVNTLAYEAAQRGVRIR